MIPNVKARLLQEMTKERDKHFTKDKSSDTKSDELVQATAATVGFVSEIIHHRNEKAAKRNTIKDDALTLVSHKARKVEEEEELQQDHVIKDLAAAFLLRHPSPSPAPSRTPTNLTIPILIPQRRPNTRARGFAPAYAPILTSFDVSEKAFLDFIITLNASLEPNPYLNAINLAGFAGEASPEPIISLMVGLGVEVVTDVIMEVQSRAKSNELLDKVNDGFFAPRGLFAFVGTWRPHDARDEHVVDVSISDNVPAPHSHSKIDVIGKAKSVATGNVAAQTAWLDLKQQMQRAIVPARGEVATLSAAPLVWASAEEVAAATPANLLKKKDRFDRAGIWLDNHVDKHSQARWTQEHPDHPLAGSLPNPEFRSRYADPNHAASSGDFISLLTGGQWHTKEDEKKKEKRLRKEQEKEIRKEQEKARKEKKKLAATAKKEKTEEDKLNAKNARCEYEDAASIDKKEVKEATQPTDSTNSNVVTEASSSKTNKREDEMQLHDSKEKNQKKAKSSNGVSSLLEDQLLYLVIVQTPSLTDRT